MSSAYVKPAAIPSDMGGSIVQVDSRLRGVLQLLEKAPLAPGQSVLDVGMGSGQLSTWLAEKGLRVTGTGLEMESYSTDLAKLQALGVQTVSCYADSMPFEDASFDIVVMSHVLEHCPNQALALSEAKRVLKDSGQLLVFVPPYTSAICAGHVSIGWNVGQLIYVLLLAGFSVKDGSFIEWSGSVCGFVAKCNGMKLPALRGDRGDLQILSRAGMLPLHIKSADGFDDGFCGDIGAINWDAAHLEVLTRTSSRVRRTLSLIASFLPLRVAFLLFRLSRLIETSHRVNPPVLTT
jgi:SAM-dependent methyltransferase